MQQLPDEKQSLKGHNRRVHMANERTFLAWMRTSIGIMAFGFVVERFALFVKQLSYFLGKDLASRPVQPGRGYSSILGIFLVGFGALTAVLAYVRYKKVQKQIEEGAYEPSAAMDLLLTMVVLAVGLFLIVYLMRSV